MSVSYLSYPLHNGYIHSWLVAGPQAIAVPDLQRFDADSLKFQVAEQYYQADSGVAQLPTERTDLVVDGAPLPWQYVRCGDDHFVDLTAFYHTCHYLRAWAYVQVEAPRAQDVTLVLTTNGPADLWLNGDHVRRNVHFVHQIPQRTSFQATLQQGCNDILVRFEAVAVRECPYAMALQIAGAPADELAVRIPTLMEPVERRQKLEQRITAGYLDQDVYVRDDEVTVRWPAQLGPTSDVAVRLQHLSGRIYAEAQPNKPVAAISLMRAYQLADGPYRAVLMPKAKEYYLGEMRLQREIGFQVLNQPYAQSPYGAYAERRREGLEQAAKHKGNLYAEIAKMELGRWSAVDQDVIHATIQSINNRADCSDFYMVGLLGMLYRYVDKPAFPEELKQPLEACVLNFRYWMDEPGSDAMCFWSENHQILFHACEILAGQLYPERVFSNAGQTGAWHRDKGERMALAWLQKRGAGGFREWDSNCYFEHDLLALSHLADLAENVHVAELAAVVMDKLFFTIAVNSYQGAFGSTHGRTYTPFIKGARLEATAGVSRLMWGMGVFNHHILGTVGLACAQSYELPAIIQSIACDQPEALWSRERHAGELEAWHDRATGDWEVNKATYKTPDYMLCSAQDYQPGQPGYQQHIWQATLGPNAVVFVTHPACVSEENSHRPNFWHGNAILPRVAQWRDVLIAVHKLPDDDWMGFTHAYFPVYAFDEYVVRDNWAFARKGSGYLALTAAAGLTLMMEGNNAYRELRSYGLHNIWLCQMGRAAQDGGFDQFQQRVLASDAAFDGLSVRYNTLRGESIQFGWQGRLVVDGQQQPLSGFKHYDNPYCSTELDATQLEIRFGDEVLRLNFAV